MPTVELINGVKGTQSAIDKPKKELDPNALLKGFPFGGINKDIADFNEKLGKGELAAVLGIMNKYGNKIMTNSSFDDFINDFLGFKTTEISKVVGAGAGTAYLEFAKAAIPELKIILAIGDVAVSAVAEVERLAAAFDVITTMPSVVITDPLWKAANSPSPAIKVSDSVSESCASNGDDVVVVPTVAVNLTVQGLRKVGETLTVKPSFNIEPDKFTCQWLRNSQAIDGAVGLTYLIQEEDEGNTITVSCTVEKEGYKSSTTTSSSGGKVKPADFDGPEPNQCDNSDIEYLGRIFPAAGGGAFALLDDGTVMAWGKNEHGGLGLGDQAVRLNPVQIAGLSNVRTIATSPYTNGALIALLDDCTLVSGVERYDVGWVPTPVPGLTGVKSIRNDPGFRWAHLALFNDGTVSGWDTNSWEMYGDPQIRKVPDLDGVESFSLARNCSPISCPLYFIQDDGSVLGFEYIPELWGYGAVPVQGLANVKAVSTWGFDEYASNFALLNDGTVMAWGYNANGRLGLGDLQDRATPTRIPGLSNVKEVIPEGFAVLNDGTVMAWGPNSEGRLGLGDTNRRLSPVPVTGLRNVETIKADWYDSVYALLSDGQVMAWGHNYYGNLGMGKPYYTSDREVLSPKAIPGLSQVAEISIADGFAFAILKNGSVMAWGENDSGQLGLGDTARRYEPTRITGLPPIGLNK